MLDQQMRVYDPSAIAARCFTCILEQETENQECLYNNNNNPWRYSSDEPWAG
jgi:hypothetical protein